VYVGEDGDILLRPVVTIPSKEAWIYENPTVLEGIRKGLFEANQGKLKKSKILKLFLKNYELLTQFRANSRVIIKETQKLCKA